MLCYMACTFLHHGGARMYQVSQQTRHKKICLQEFLILLALNYYTVICTCDFYRYEHVYTYRKKEFQNILKRKKIMQLV